MNIFKKYNRKPQVKNKISDLLDLLGISGEIDSKRLSEVTYFSCLKILSESIGKMPLKLLKNEEGGIKKAFGHPLYSVVGYSPNNYMTATTFWSTVEQNRNHYGNAYVYVIGSGENTKLVILPPEKIEILVDNKNIFKNSYKIWYFYEDLKCGLSLAIPDDSILHFKTSMTFDGILGKPVREILKTTLVGGQRAQNMLNSAYDNGFTGKVVLQYTAELDSKNEEKYKKRIEEFARNKDSKIIPMMFGTSIQPISTKLADNQFVELKKYSALQIAGAFGIKPNQINDYEKSSYASAEAQQLAFYVDTLLYILKQYEEELTKKLLSREEIQNGLFFKFNVSSILRADLKTQIESLTKAVMGGIKTPNEARVMLDLPSLAGGDKLICNGNMIPVEMAGMQYANKSIKN